jgi:hypothetical protein
MSTLTMVLVIAGVLVIFIASIIAWGSIAFVRLVDEEANELARQAETADMGSFSGEAIEMLPEPVRRYMSYAMPEDPEAIRFVRMKQTGLFCTAPGQDWMPMDAEQYFITKQPGFIWHAKVRPSPVIWIEARDRYGQGQGNMKIKFLSTIPLADARGPEMDVSSLLRYLGEMPWFPAAFLNGDVIEWEAIDASHARATITDGHLSGSGVFSFDEAGRILTFATDERYRTVDDEYVRENFTGRYADYREQNGVKIPHEVEAVWNLPEGDYPYARIRIAEIEYDVFSGY